MEELKRKWKEIDAYRRKIAAVEKEVLREIKALAADGDRRDAALRALYWDFGHRIAPSLLAEVFGLSKPGELAEAAGSKTVSLECLACGESRRFRVSSRSVLEAMLRERPSERPKHRVCASCQRLRGRTLEKLRARGRPTAADKRRYYAYLETSEWTETREKALRRAKHRCQLCSSRKSLQVHHRTYERLGEERPADLIVLCSRCHRRHHH